MRWKLRKHVAVDLKPIYQSAVAEEAEGKLTQFKQKRGAAYPSIVRSWRRNWPRIIPFFDYPPEIGRVIYINNMIRQSKIYLQ